MSDFPRRISLREVGPRDGLQNEAPVPTAAKVALIDALSRTGVGRIEAVSFVSQGDPADGRRRRGLAQIERGRRVRYSALVPNLRGAERALAAGLHRDRGGRVGLGHAQPQERQPPPTSPSTRSPSCSTSRTTPARPARSSSRRRSAARTRATSRSRASSTVAGRAVADGADGISFGDTTGMATPSRVTQLVGEFRSAHPDAPLNLHFHNTRGTGLANVLAALQLGVADFDASVGGLGGCPYAPGATGNVVHRGPRAHGRGHGRRDRRRPRAPASTPPAWPRASSADPAEPGAARRSADRDEQPDRTPSKPTDELRADVERGGRPKYHEANAAKGKLFARERIALLVDEGSFVEDGLLANVLAGDLPADGVVTGTATIDGRPVCLMANDSTVKAGSWGARTVEKIIRIIETAYRDQVPMVYLVDSAGARITDQVEMFPGRRGAGQIFHTQVRASGSIPQVCALFGPSAAGGAYIPAFCDIVVMVEGNASMYLGSPRMVEMVIGEKTTLEEMGGARMHCSVSGCRHASW